jgi:toxin ParE1/3/4
VHVRWLRVALANLDAEAEFIVRENPAAAGRVVAAVDRAVQKLRRYPALGRPGRVIGTRELIVPGTPYIVPYRIRNDTVEVLRVFHAARRWPEKL